MNIRSRLHLIVGKFGTFFAWIAALALGGALIAGLIFFKVRGCSAGDDAYNALDNAGYSDIQLRHPDVLRCSGTEDSFSNTFQATNPAGKKVEGVVCCGWLKGCTIRF